MIDPSSFESIAGIVIALGTIIVAVLSAIILARNKATKDLIDQINKTAGTAIERADILSKDLKDSRIDQKELRKENQEIRDDLQLARIEIKAMALSVESLSQEIKTLKEENSLKDQLLEKQKQELDKLYEEKRNIMKYILSLEEEIIRIKNKSTIPKENFSSVISILAELKKNIGAS